MYFEKSVTRILVLTICIASIVLSTSIPFASGDANNPIKHIVIIMQENHSFDSYFGTYPGANGIPSTWCMPKSLTNQSQGCVKPWLTTKYTDGDLGHVFNDSHIAWDNGKMDGFVVDDNGNNHTMSYHDNSTIPFYWNFAQHYTLADNFFSSVLSYTLPNRWYSLAAQAPATSITNGISANISPTILNQFYSQVNNTNSIVDSLNASGISWKYYGNVLPVGGYKTAVKSGTTLDLFNPLAAKPSSYTSSYAPHFVNRTDIFTDIKNNNLPQVSWVEPTFYLSEHPPYSIKVGMTWVTQIVDSIMNSTSWNSTAIIITYDEYGGYADHVIPPVLDSQGASVRVPAIIISPYAKPGYIDHTTYTFESMLKFIEWRYNLPSLTARDTNANNTLNSFNFTQQPLPPSPVHLSSYDLATLTPIYLTPTSANVGDPVNFVGNGFDAGQQVKVTMNNTLISTGSANSTGSYVITFNVPTMPAGRYTLTDTGPYGDPNRITFSITSALKTNSSNAAIGKTVKLNGTGFSANSLTTIKYNGNQIATLTSTKSGTFTLSYAVPPTSKAGANNFTASDSAGHTANVSISVPDTIPPTITVPNTVVANTSNFTGTTVTYTVSATDPDDSPFTLSCNPSSGSLFPIGNTTVSCTAIDTANNSAVASFPLIVNLNPIEIAAPPNIIAEATGPLTNMTLGAPTVNDSQDNSPIITNNASSIGFPLGSTIVMWTATDHFGNTVHALQNVTINDTTPPAISIPSLLTTEATGSNGSVVNYNATESDLVDGFGSKLKASVYFSGWYQSTAGNITKKYLGTTDYVSSLGNFSNGFNNFPNQNKIISSPSLGDLQTQINSNLIKNLQPKVRLNYDIENWRFTPSSEQGNVSGSIYQASNLIHSNGYLAETSPIIAWTKSIYQTFDWTKIDDLIMQLQSEQGTISNFIKDTNNITAVVKSKNPATQTFAQVSLQAPSNAIYIISGLKDSPTLDGIAIIWAPSTPSISLDDVLQYIKRGLVCNPPPGSTFPLGNTTVTCSSTDAHGNNSTKTFTIWVRDTTPPTITAPSSVTTPATGVMTNVTLGKPKVSDIVDTYPIITNNASAAGFPIGTTTVLWTVTDHSGNSATATQSVTILNQIGIGTTITLKSISNVPWGNTIIVSGSLTNSSNGIGLSNKTITFNGTGNVNLQPIVTSTNGSFTVSGTAPTAVVTGLTVQAHFAGDSSHFKSDSSIQTYSTTPHRLTLGISSKNVPWGQATSFVATLTDQNNGNSAVSGKLIHFNGTGVIGVIDQTTNSTGKAVETGTAPGSVASGWTYQAHYAGDPLYYKVDSAKSTFNTVLHTTSLTIIAPTSVTHGTSYSIGGTLKDMITGSTLSSKTITFTATSPIVINNAPTNSVGQYSVSGLTAPSAGSYNIQARFSGDSLYSLSNSQQKTLTVS